MSDRDVLAHKPRINAESLRLRLEFVTPAFIGGADPNTTCELRPPSIKGALRFWFRFAEGARQQTRGGKYWESVAQREAALFGSSDTGVGLMSLRVVRQPNITTPVQRGWSQEIGYMGYGPVAYSSRTRACEPQRPFIDVGETTELELRFSSRKIHSETKTDGQERNGVVHAIKLWANLGGLGSRSRRGWGSFVLRDPADLLVDLGGSKALVNASLTTLLRGVGGDESASAAFTHGSRQAQIRCVHIADTWTSGMQWIGRKLINFRTNRRRGGSCWTDHEVIRQFLSDPSYTLADPPRRAAFGLPHNYFFGSLKNGGHNPYKATVQASRTKKGRSEIVDRRSSPLFVRLQKLPSDQIAVIVMFVPTPFLPIGEHSRITVTAEYDNKLGAKRESDGLSGRSHEPDTADAAVCDYAVINEFLETLEK